MPEQIADDWFAPLETERLNLRPMEAGDLDFVFEHFSDPQVHKYLFDAEPTTTMSLAEEIVGFYADPAKTRCNRWVLVLKETGEPVGTCGFHRWFRMYSRAEIGYDLRPAHRGKGLMTEALTAAIAVGFDKMRLNRIEALIYVENTRSIAILERLGFTNEGALRDFFQLDGRFYDHVSMSLLRREWKRQRVDVKFLKDETGRPPADRL